MPSLLGLCRAWQTAQSARHPLIETLGTLLFIPKLHPRPRYLLFVQALEGLYGHDHAHARAERQRRHTDNYNAALGDVASTNGVAPSTLRFLKRNLMRKPIESLEPALRAIVSGLPVDLSPQFSELDLVREVRRSDAKAEADWPMTLRIVRNDLSHGTRGWPREQLEDAADFLETVARAHMMRLLGCSDAVVGEWLSGLDLD